MQDIKLSIRLEWKLRKDGAEYHLKCGDTICGRMVIEPNCDTAIEAGGCGIALWGAHEDGCDFEYTGTSQVVRQRIEKDAEAFFVGCFGKNVDVLIFDDCDDNVHD